MGDRRREKRPLQRRPRTAASALVAILVAFALGVLLNAPAMKKSAMELPFGGERSFRLALVGPLAAVSHWTLLDRPGRFVAESLGKPDPGHAAVVASAPRPTPSASAGRPQPVPVDKPLPKPYAGHPMRLYIAGDSMAGIPGMALVNLSKRTRLIRPLLDYRISTGLVRPDFFDWPAQLQRQADAFKPGAAVVMWGANDNQGIQTASGKVHQFGSSGWEEEYRRRVRDALTILFNSGVRRVYWVGQPVMAEAAFDRQIRTINDIFRTEAEKRPGVQYIDAYAALSHGGRYTQYLEDERGNTQQVREGDGEHITYAGGMVLAKSVMTAIKEEWFTRQQPK